MSTKCSLAYGPDFHLYHDLMDEDEGVCLRMPMAHFEMNLGEVTLRIPIEVWEFIRHKGAADLSLANLSDEELQKKVEAEVDDRISEIKASSADSRPLLNLAGFLIYGNGEDSRELQIKRAIDYYTLERERQQEVQSKIEAFRASERTRKGP